MPFLTRLLATLVSAPLLVAMGGVAPGVVQPAQAVAADVGASRALLPAGQTFSVTRDGNEGEGTFGAAVALANATPGPDTIAFADGLSVTLTASWELTESLTIQGAGATVIWKPATPSQEPWVQVNDATVQLFDMTLAQGSTAWEPAIFVSNAPEEFATVLEDVSFEDVVAGGLHVEEAAGGVEVSRVTARGSGDGLEPQESAVIEVWGYGHGVSVADSRFSELATTAVAVLDGELGVGEQTILRNNEFANIDAEEPEFPGAAITVESVYDAGDGARALPAVQLSENTFSRVQGPVSSVVSVSNVEGGLQIDHSAFVETDVDFASLWVNDASGGFGSDGRAVVVDEVNLEQSQAEGHVMLLENVRGSALIEHVSLADAAVGTAALGVLDMGEGDDGEYSSLEVRDTQVLNVTGQEQSAPAMAGISFEYLDADVLLERVSVDDTEAEEAGILFSGTSGNVQVDDSQAVENTAPGMRVDDHVLPENGKFMIERSTFSLNTVADQDEAGGLILDIMAAVPQSEPAIEIRDSSVTENVGGAAGGADIKLSGADAEATGRVLVEGSTFWHPRTSEDALAGDVRVSTAASQDDSVALTIRNSTFERRDAMAKDLPSVVIAGAAADTVLEHVSMPGGSLYQECDECAVTANNSALGSDSRAAIAATGGFAIEGSANTMPMLGQIPAAVADVLPVAEWGLGQLGDNGGPTLTLLPSASSPLVDAANSSDVARDQRGVTRPQGSAPDRGAVEVEGATASIEMGPDVRVEAGATAVLEVKRTGPAESAATVVVELRDGTAVASTDYQPQRFELAWPAGNSEAQKLKVRTMVRGEPGERAFTAALVEPNGAEIGVRSAAKVTIVEQEPGEGGGSPGPGGGIEPENGAQPHPGGGGALGETGSDVGLTVALIVVALLLGAGGVFAVIRARRASSGADVPPQGFEP